MGSYILKVWLTSVIGGPVLLIIRGLADNAAGGWRDVGAVFIVILFGAILSLPSMLLFYLVARFVIPKTWNTILFKVLLSIAGIILTYIPFLLIDNFHWLLNVDMMSRPFFLTYAGMIVAGIWLYKLRPVPPSSVDQPGIV